MAILKDMGSRVANAACVIRQKTNSTVQMGKLKSRRQMLTEQAEDLYNRIGRAYCAGKEDNCQEDADRLFEKLTRLRGTIDNVDDVLERIRGRCRCPSCGLIQPLEAKFCSMCGTRLSKTSGDGFQNAESGGVAVKISWPGILAAAQDGHAQTGGDEASSGEETQRL